MGLQEPDNYPKKSFRISKQVLVWTLIIGAVVAFMLYLIRLV